MCPRISRLLECFRCHFERSTHRISCLHWNSGTTSCSTSGHIYEDNIRPIPGRQRWVLPLVILRIEFDNRTWRSVPNPLGIRSISKARYICPLSFTAGTFTGNLISDEGRREVVCQDKDRVWASPPVWSKSPKLILKYHILSSRST